MTETIPCDQELMQLGSILNSVRMLLKMASETKAASADRRDDAVSISAYVANDRKATINTAQFQRKL